MKVVLVSVILCLTATVVPVAAQAVTKSYQLNIPKQPLDAALKDLAQQTGLQIGRLPDREGTAPVVGPVSGAMSVENALHTLLGPTQFTYKVVNDSTIAVLAVDAPPGAGIPATQSSTLSSDGGNPGAGGDPKEGKNGSSENFRMAQVDPTNAGSQVKPVPGAGAEGLQLQEVVVTAQKRDELLQNVPVPVTAIDANVLTESNQTSLQDYYSSVPGLSFNEGDRGEPFIAIRGLTTGGGLNPTVGITIDDVPLGSSTSLGGGFIAPDIDPSELARIEVLRGPQGTLYGAGSMGGLLKYVTVDPSTSEVTGRLQAGTGWTQNGAAPGYVVRGATNVPLTQDLAVRVSGFSSQDPGYVDNVQAGQKAVNKADTYGGRAAALWKPGDEVSLKVSALFQDYQRDGSPLVSDLANLAQQNTAGTGWYHSTVQAYSADLEVDLGAARLTSLTGYNIDKWSSSTDFTPYAFLYGVAAASIPEQNTTDKVTEELRAAIPIATRLDWLVGTFYTHEGSPYVQNTIALDPASGAYEGTLEDTTWRTTYEEYAGFTDLTVHATDRLDLQLGARESQIRQTYAFVASGPDATPDVPTIRLSENAFTYLVTPSFHVSPDLMVYGRFASGYRPGGPNPSASQFPGVPATYQPDSTNNYEVGAKGSAWNRMLSFDASLYYIDWKHIQIYVFDQNNGAAFYENGARAKSQGVELSLQAKPIAGLTLASWLVFDDAVLTEPLPTGTVSATAYGASGDHLPNSSRVSANVSADQEFPLGRGATGSIGVAASYVGDRKGNFASSATTPPPDLPGYTKVDVRAALKRNEWAINLFATNIANKRGILSQAVIYSEPYAPNEYAIIQPRTVGLSVTRTF